PGGNPSHGRSMAGIGRGMSFARWDSNGAPSASPRASPSRQPRALSATPSRADSLVKDALPASRANGIEAQSGVLPRPRTSPVTVDTVMAGAILKNDRLPL